METNPEKYTPLMIETQPGSYAMFLPPDMSVVKIFRKNLCDSLRKNGFQEEDILQVELACDEALTNSITANVSSNSEETIICRWIIKDMKITVYILDYGSGFLPNPSQLSTQEPTQKTSAPEEKNIESFLEGIKNYQETKQKSLPYKGVKVGHKNIGKGLKIIYSLMDSVKILFHSNGVVVENPNEGNISGSIVELEYDVKKKSS